MSHDRTEEPRSDSRASAPVKAGRTVVFLSVAAIAIAATGIKDRRQEHERLARWTEEQAIPTVALVSPKRAAEEREVVLPGDVEAYYAATIHGRVSGYVREWRKDIGASVRQGDVLAIVDTPELDERIAVAQSELAKAKANLLLAKTTAERWNSLRASAAVSQQAADEKESDARAKSAELEAAQANLDRMKALKAFANIVAPFDGVVTARNVDVGSLVKADSNDGPALFAVADLHQMRVYVRAPESYAAVIKDGMKGTLELPEYPNRKFEATVVTTSHAIDKKSRTLLVELIADNKEGELSPGAFARVHFKLPPDPDAVTLPASALLFRDNALQVATLGLDNRIALKKVRIARDFGSEVEILGGLGERVVANPSDSIADGEEVRVMNAAGEKSNAPAEQQQGAQVGGRGKAGRKVAETERGAGE